AVAAAAWVAPTVGAPLAATLVGVLAALAAADYLRLPRKNAITVERAAPETVGLGDDADVVYTIRSAWSWRARAVLYDRIPTGLSGAMGKQEHTLAPLGEQRLALRV